MEVRRPRSTDPHKTDRKAGLRLMKRPAEAEHQRRYYTSHIHTLLLEASEGPGDTRWVVVFTPSERRPKDLLLPEVPSKLRGTVLVLE